MTAKELAASDGTTAAVIVTYNRAAVLRRTLRAVLGQSRQPDEIWVVDNASQDGTEEVLAREFPGLRYLRLSENRGYGAGLKAGMEQCADRHRWLWLLDDDSTPRSVALQRCLEVACALPGIGMVGLDGGALRWGVPDHHPHRKRVVLDAPRAYASGFLLVDGAVVSCAAVHEVGYPRDDFFMMMEDVEYSGRLAGAGWQLVVLGESLIERGHMGSGDERGTSPPWRAYYQTRNHLITALDRRSPTELAGWAWRQAKFVLATAVVGDRKAERLQLRARGAWDGFRGRRGRTLEPSSSPYPLPVPR